MGKAGRWDLWKVLLLTVAGLSAGQSVSFGQPVSKNVLIVHFGWERMPVNQIVSRVMERQLTSASGLQVRIFQEYLDDLRMEVDQRRLADSIRGKYYPSHRPDLVIAVGTSTANLFSIYGTSHFPGVPVVFLMVDDYFFPITDLPPTMTGVTYEFDFAGTIRLALHLNPETKNVFYVTGMSGGERAYEELFKKEIAPLFPNQTIGYLDSFSLGELLTHLGQLPPRSIVVYSAFFVDRAGVAYVAAPVAAPIAAASNSPVYGISGTYLGSGIAGGSMFDVEEMSLTAASMATRILRGEKPSAISPVAGASQWTVDERQLERWKIDRSRVPKGTRIVNTEPGVWRRYKRAIAGSAAVFVGLLILIAWLMREIRRRKQSESALQTLSSHLITAQEQERSRIARELHDGVGQQVATLSLASHLLAEEIPPSNKPALAQLSRQQEQFGELARAIRDLSHNLHPSILRTCGLEQALREHCAEFERLQGIAVGLDCPKAVDSIAPQAALCLFRITQEALRNVAKHAGTDVVEVSVVPENGVCVLTVRDYGRGFDRMEVYRNGGLGLISMEERLRALQGSLNISTKRGRGTTIVVRVPHSNGEQRSAKGAAAGRA